MLFHEPAFLYLFLPVTLAFYYVLHKTAEQSTIVVFLSLASLFFYGWWNPRLVPLLVGSVLFNFFLGDLLQRFLARSRKSRWLLACGIGGNFALLVVFKYLGFVAGTLNSMSGLELSVPQMDLPLGISFFTFLQIAYLVDCYRGEVRNPGFAKYVLFVTFFPHLIAGPLVHHSELIPQFRRKVSEIWENLFVGATIFFIGVFKKVVIARQAGIWADAVFDGAAAGDVPTLFASWIGVITFAFEIYFDFSAYSDMAIGLSRVFGIQLPVNFASPYKSSSIIEFWHRWHVTLSRFFREYLYIPLGGNRCGRARHYLNVMVVMLLAGLWHGADWKFVLWGGLHGTFLTVNHLWSSAWKASHWPNGFLPRWFSVFLTFLAVVVAWVPFRAASLTVAGTIFNGLAGNNGIVLPSHYEGLLDRYGVHATHYGISFGALPTYGGGWQLFWLAAGFFWVWFLPATQEIMRNYKPALEVGHLPAPYSPLSGWIVWRPYRLVALLSGVCSAYLAFRAIQGQPGEFIYFKF